jgi:hypothetical protein
LTNISSIGKQFNTERGKEQLIKATGKYTLLLLIFVFAFIYRLILMLWASYPPGADIGLHNSVINSITQSGNTNFLYDFYQMGGGESLTFPGYHIFASGIILVTGMPDYIAQSIIVALFSSFIVLAAYLITKAAWTESSALIVAFLVAVSRFDIEMLLWGGYPNVITLLLIPLTLYFYLQKDRFSFTPFIISTSILVSSIFLTHSLSSVIFVGITFAIAILVMIAPKSLGTLRKHVLYLLLPIFGGLILVSPFLADAVPTYLRANSAFTGTTDINSALLSTRILPLSIILPLFAILVLFFFLSKEYIGRFFSLQAIVFFIWLLFPLILTQGFLFGLYIDYNRFLYFIILPVIVLIGLFIDHGSLTFARIIDNFRVLSGQMQKIKKTTNKFFIKMLGRMTRKTIYASFVLGLLLVVFLVFPIFVTPWEGNRVQSFYQVMDNSGYQAIQWAEQNTPSGSVFVSDALYGWWFSGFAQRPTLSAVDPQYLTVSRELFPAKNASLVLDTDYMIDNGYIQVREDGGYLSRHNPEILAKLNWTYFPYSFFNFNTNQIKIEYQINRTVPQQVHLDALSVRDMQLLMGNENGSATIIVSRSNDLFNYTQFTTIYKGLPFVNITATINSTVNGVSIDFISYSVESKGTILQYDNRTVGWIDQGVKAFGQLIFLGNLPDVSTTIPNPPPYDITVQYALNGTSEGQIQMLASAYSVTDSLQFYKDKDTENKYFDPIIASNLDHTQQPIPNPSSLTIFDYRAALQQWSVSYIANRIFEQNPKFADDPTFSLVFINNEIAIFKVKANVSIAGS